MSKLVDINESTAPSAPPCYDEAMVGHPYPAHQPHAASYPQIPPIMYPPPTQPVIVTQQPYPAQTSVRPVLVGPNPLSTTCPSCHKHIVTKTTARNRYLPHVCCFVMLISVVCSLCSCLPYCLCPQERVEHTCPNCNNYFGTYSRK